MQKVVKSNSKINRFKKLILRHSRTNKNLPRSVFLIMGCQRSGTTMVSRAFDALPYCKVYGEYNHLANPANGDNPLQLRDLSRLEEALEKEVFPLRVMKPLADSQRALEIKKAAGNARILWLWRNYHAVARSNIAKFGEWHGGHSHLDGIIAGRSNDWRRQNVSAETRRIIGSFKKQGTSAIDAACLFWYARNILFFEQDLDKRSDVTLWRYEHFVAAPKLMLDGILGLSGYPDSPSHATRWVSRESLDAGSGIDVSPKIAFLCDGLEERLSSMAQ